MPLTFDNKDALAKLDQLLPKVLRGAEKGLSAISTVVEEAMQTDPAHGDQSGAAHASYVAAVAGGSQDAQGELDFAMAVAADRLEGFTGHEGHAARVEAPTLNESERALVLSSPVDYAESLEAEGRSPVKPTLQQYAPAIKQSVADGIKEELRA